MALGEFIVVSEPVASASACACACGSGSAAAALFLRDLFTFPDISVVPITFLLASSWRTGTWRTGT